MDKTRILKTMSFLLATFLLLVIVPCGTLAAEESSQKEGWEFDAALYLWGASIGGTTTEGDEIDVGFNDIIKNFDFGHTGNRSICCRTATCRRVIPTNEHSECG